MRDAVASQELATALDAGQPEQRVNVGSTVCDVGTDQRAGTRIGAYLIGDVIGRGGMGVVYRATHEHLGRDVALKLLAPQLIDIGDFRERFLRESRIAASLDHPNVVTVYDAGEIDGTLYIAMRYIEGTDLAHLIRLEGPLEPARTVAMLDQVARALDAAHGRGLIHRDVKPANVMICAGHCYLSDFGLTKRAGAGDASAALTQTGQFLGTIDYVAPEQIEGRSVDGRTDEYALACMLHECLTASRPFPRDSELAVISAHLLHPPPRPTELRPELPEAIDDVVARGMAKSAEDRYASCSELIAAAGAALGPDRGAQRTKVATSRGPAAPTVVVPDAHAPTTAPAVAAPATTRAAASGATSAPRPRVSRRQLIGSGVVAAVAVAIVIVLLASGGSGSNRHRVVGRRAAVGGHPSVVTPVAQAAHVVGNPIHVGNEPIGIAGNAKVLWVANFNGSTISRVTLNGAIRTDIALPPGPFGVFNTGTTFWVSSADSGVVTPIRVATGLPGKPIPVGLHPEFITGDQNAIYVSNAKSDTVSVINARTDAVIGRPIPVGTFPRGITFSGTAVWVADFGSDNVDRIVNGTVILRIPVGKAPVGATFGDGAVWVANSGSNTVSRIELAHDNVMTIPVGKNPFAIAFGLGSVWVTNRGDGTVTRLDAATGAPIGRPIAVGGDPTGIAVIGGDVWVTDRASDTVHEIAP